MNIRTISCAALMVFSASILAGCNEDEKTVEWWSNHDQERKEFVEECKNNNADEITANCQNAMEAEGKKQIIGKKGEIKSPKISLDISE